MPSVNNPLRYSDLIAKDASISELIRQLGELEAKMNGVRSRAEALREGMAKISSAAAANSDTLVQNAREAEQLSASYGKLKGEYAAVTAALARETGEMKANTQAEIAAARQMDAMSRALQENVSKLRLAEEAARTARTQISNLEKAMQGGGTAAQRAELEKYRLSLQQARENVRTLTLEVNNQIREMKAAPGSLTEMQERLRSLQRQWADLAPELRDSDIGKGMLESMQPLYKEVSRLEALMGRHQRNVGNYAGSFGMLQMSVQQVARELPSLAINWNTFFLAISNNIPMLADQIKIARDEYKALKQKGQEAVPVWKQIGKSLLSGQMILVGVVTALSLYGKEIIDWVKNIGKSREELEKEAKQMERNKYLMEQNAAMNKKIADDAGTLTALYIRLRHEWRKASDSMEERRKFIDRNQDSFARLGRSINDVSTAERYFVDQTANVLEAFKLRAQATAAFDRLTEVYQRQITQQQNAVNETNEKPEFSGNTLTIKSIDILKKFLGENFSLSEIPGIEVYDPNTDRLATASWDMMANRFNDKKEYVITDRKAFNEFWNKAQYAYRQQLNEEINRNTEADASRLLSYADKSLERLGDLEDEIRVPEAGKGKGGGGRTSGKLQKTFDDLAKLLEKLRQLRIANEQDEYKRRRQEIEFNAEKEIGQYQSQLEQDPGMTAQKRTAINDIIKEIQTKRDNELEELEEAHQLELLKIESESLDKRLSLQRKGTEEWLKLALEKNEKEREIALKGATEEQKVTINAVYDSNAQSFTDENNKAIYDNMLKEHDLQAELEESRFNLIKHTEDEITRYKLEQQKKRLQAELEANKATGVLNAKEVEIIKNTIAALDMQIGAVGEKKRFSNIYEVFGLSIKDKDGNDVTDEVTQSIDDVMNTVQDALNTWMDARLEAAEANVEAAKTEVEAAQDWLASERAARANGYANNVEMAQKELNLAKQNHEKELAEQRKIQAQQIMLDSAMQASSMITATANIWKAFSPLGGFGVAAALAAIAVMWSAFIASRAKAVQLAKNPSGASEQYGEGTVELLQGGSHASGNDIDLGVKPDGTRRRAEGGEFFAVINKRSSQKYRNLIPDVINSLNKGTFARKYANSYESADISVSLTSGGKTADLSRIETDLKAIRRQGVKRYRTDKDGNTVMEYKNLTRRIRC